jgi:hypothetical protein
MTGIVSIILAFGLALTGCPDPTSPGGSGGGTDTREPGLYADLFPATAIDLSAQTSEATILGKALKWLDDHANDTSRVDIAYTVIPEDVDYTTAFEDIFREYTYEAKLEKVRTTNLGSLYDLRYEIELKDLSKEKEFLDKIRQRNSNLDISCGSRPPDQNVL